MSDVNGSKSAVSGDTVSTLFRLVLGFLVLAVVPAVVWAAPAGELTAKVRGEVVARGSDGKIRLLEDGARVSAGDLLSTGKGFAALRLDDGTLVTLRPDTTFSVETFAYGQGAVSARLSLISGGVRVITGRISERSPERFLLVTPEGTLHPHGTDFEARVCGSDCADEARRLKPSPRTDKPQVVARVVFLRGRATAAPPTGRIRTMALGSSLFEKETVRSTERSWVNIAFSGGPRLILDGESSLIIERYLVSSARTQIKDARLRLLKGSMRLLAGLKQKHLTIATAAGDFRATSKGVDVVCTGRCRSGPDRGSSLFPRNPMFAAAHGLLDLLIPPAHARTSTEGLLIRPWGGGDLLLTGTGGSSAQVASGRVVWLKGPDEASVLLRETPASMSFSGVPRPDLPESMDPRMRDQVLFGGVVQNTPMPGLYIRVISGDLTFLSKRGHRLDLGAGESAFSELGRASGTRLLQPPPLLETPVAGYLQNLSTRLRLPVGVGGAEAEKELLEHCLIE